MAGPAAIAGPWASQNCPRRIQKINPNVIASPGASPSPLCPAPRHRRADSMFATLAARTSLDSISNAPSSGLPVPVPARDESVDPDLSSVLAMASDEELYELYRDLHGTSILSPLGKSLQRTVTPRAAKARGRTALIRSIDHRFRFLAADASAILRGRLPSYRDALLAIHERLDAPCPSDLSTHDLESEIFLLLLKEHAGAVDAASPASAAAAAMQGGDGMASPPTVRRKTSLVQKALAPLKFGAQEVVPVLTRVGAVLSVTSIHANMLARLGAVLARRGAQYETAAHLATMAGGSTGRAALRAAHRRLTDAASKYGLARGLVGVVAPILWASAAADLARMSLGTDWLRIVRAVFVLAQIRLLRTEGWATKSQCLDESSDE